MTHNLLPLDRCGDLANELTAPILYLVPSRGRPGNIAELLAAWDAMLSLNGLAQLVVMLDEDDPELTGYLDVVYPTRLNPLDDPHRPWLGVTIGPRLRLGGTLNHAAPVFARTPGRVAVGFMGDDHRPRTHGFDGRILEAHLLGGRVVYGNDLVQGQALPTACTIDARIIALLDRMVPVGAVHLYLDDYWRTLGKDLEALTYLDDVIIEHLHPTAGTADHDAGYAEVNHPDVYRHDEQVYRDHLDQQHPADLELLAQLR